ncbi:cytochrome P450 [Actinomadura madurae]|uniref:cytochrome P450 n=1 Tax=Actinomadura madurae TaxID=1993 RepID=UPI0020D2523A|nr:cytochrome P450 [Actinomadura madurae]MCQ0019530.1 cytochrome P450 [Actinomadura madurae]
MTTQHTEAQHTESGRTPIYGPEFARDPAAAYARMRAEHGDLAPVELSPGVPATLVLGYDAALEILRDPGTFPRCSEVWEEAVGPECPVLPMMMTRPSALFTNGAVHARLRSVIVDSLERVDPVSLRGYVASNADSLIDRFAADGKADLIGQYARALPLLVFNEMFGCPEDIGAKLVRGMSAIFDTVSAEEGNALLMEATAELVAAKRRRPGADVTSWMMAHPAGLDDTEMAHQIILLVGAARSRSRTSSPTASGCCCPTTGSAATCPAAACRSRTRSTRSCGPTRRWPTTGRRSPARTSTSTGTGCPRTSPCWSATPPRTPTRHGRPPTGRATAPTCRTPAGRTTARPRAIPGSSRPSRSSSSSTASRTWSWPSRRTGSNGGPARSTAR